MRTRTEIVDALYNIKDFQGSMVPKDTHLILETLLDIRDLLSAKSKPEQIIRGTYKTGEIYLSERERELLNSLEEI